MLFSYFVSFQHKQRPLPCIHDIVGYGLHLLYRHRLYALRLFFLRQHTAIAHIALAQSQCKAFVIVFGHKELPAILFLGGSDTPRCQPAMTQALHLAGNTPQTAAYTAEIYKRFRKWNGIPTSLTQNVKDLLDSSEIENILENSDFVLMLNQGASDRNILAQRLGISPQELSHVTNSSEGEGLLFFGDKIIPFEDKFPRDTQLYRVMTTKPSDLAA